MEGLLLFQVRYKLRPKIFRFQFIILTNIFHSNVKLHEDEGQDDPAKFLRNVTKTQKALNDLISAAWKLQTSVSKLEREKIPCT